MSELTRRTVIAGLLSMLVARPARSNPDWPDRPITMLHGFPPGGPTDLVARIVADGLTRRLGQRVVIESKPGASGTTAAALAARAAPDGYTLFAIPSGHAFAAATYKTLPYRTIDDFAMISMFTEYPYVLATYADHSMRTVADLITLARTRSTPLLYGTPGNGSGPHLAVELLAKEAQVRLQHVPYRGSAPAALDLIGKRLDFMMDPA
ncbi:MAG: tripartite tricarboxylate transporter substrate binding protein, partial [Hyphomicrobiales bacterium]|nr:tripartite tricarboxylate transporter substrate binding protein [Hyphomicrobiales bacterium]